MQIEGVMQNPQLEGGPFLWEGDERAEVGILLIHGFTATTAEVRPLARRLHEAGYTVAAPLLPGHGTTPEDMNRRRWTEWVGAAKEMFQRLRARCEVIFVGGESMGALTALYLASRYEAIAGLLTFAPAIEVASPKARLALLLAQINPIIPKPGSDQTEPLTPADELWQGYRVVPVRALWHLMRMQKVMRRRFGLIRQPILIVQGRLDGTVTADGPAILARELGSSWIEIHWMANSTHCVLIDGEREEVEALTLEFIERRLRQLER